jgi:hypothetical protein
MKEHKGSLKNWRKYECPGHGLGYLILGEFVDHPQFAGHLGNTSYVVAHDEATGEIETRNSRYTLLG